MGNGIERRILSIATTGLLLASTIAVGLGGKNENSSGQNCSDVGEQKQIPTLVTLPNRNIVKGISVAECQPNLHWYNDGTIYISTTPTTKK